MDDCEGYFWGVEGQIFSISLEETCNYKNDKRKEKESFIKRREILLNEGSVCWHLRETQ